MADPTQSAGRAYYFGCLCGVNGETQAGHYLHDDHLRTVSWRERDAQPWGYIDAQLAPKLGRHEEAPQGHAALHHKDGWTALAFWDRSGDSRDNSNSAFLFDHVLTFDAALAAAREAFPALFERFPFDVVEADDAR